MERANARRAAGVPALDGDFEARLRLFETCLSRLNDCVLIGRLDENGSPRIIYVNDAFVRRTGYTRSEIVGQMPRILNGPETQLDAVARLEAAVAECRPHREELLCYTKAGERIWLEVEVSAIADASGRAAHWITIERDITERKRAEEELRRSEAHYRVLFANNPLPMWVYDLSTLAFLAVNDAAIEHYGYTREQFLSMTIGDIRPPEDLGALWHSVHTGEDGLGKSGVWRHRTADGRLVRVEISSYSLMFDGRPARLVLAHDVTNQLAAEEALRASEAGLARAQRIAHLGSWDLDIATGRLSWSDEMYRMFGINPRDFTATYDTFVAAVHPEDRQTIQSAHRRACAGEARLDIEHRIVRPDGSIRWVHEVGELQYDESVTPVRLTGTVLDITSRKRHELLQAREGEILEAISSAKPLDTILELAASTIEALEPSLLATVLVPDARGTHLVVRASPSLPAAFAQAIGPVPIRDRAGSCGTAAFRRQPVLVSDIDRDPLSQDYRAAALDNGLRACWSTPVFDSAANVIATLSVYRRERGLPSAAITDLIQRLRDLITIAFERDRKEAELRASEERFRLLATSTNDAIWDWNASTGTLWWNEGAGRLYGVSLDGDEPGLTSWTRRIHPDERDRVVESFEAAVASGATSWSAEYRFLRKDGTYATVFDRGQILYDATGRAIRAIGGMTDVSERRAVEEKLHEQATLLDKASDAIVVRGLEHDVLYWNRGAEALYGWSAAEARGRRMDELLFGDRGAFDAATAATLANGEWAGEVVQRTREGRIVRVLARWTLLRDASGAPRSILAINTDITERKQLEQQLLRSQRLESIGTLAGGIAHDLNNLLQPILMGVDCLRDVASDPEHAEDLASIEACAVRGANMVRQLLSFARGNDADKKPISIADVGHELSKLIRDTFPKSIQFATAFEPGLWPIRANATQLHQLVLNLCVNARDAMPDGGKLTLALSNVRVDDPPANAIGTAKPGSYVMIEVRDTGTGISAEVQERIFDPFFTMKAPAHGTGLGLSTVHAIVRGHEGFLTLASTRGQGTTFRIYIPATTDAVASRPARVTSATRAENGQCILLVDDEPYVRQMARRILEQHGYRVLLAASGIEAVPLFARERDRIDAVLIDLAMPGIDGTMTIAALKQLDPEVRLVGASGLPSPEFVRSVHEFVAKPLSAAAMLDAIAAVLAR